MTDYHILKSGHQEFFPYWDQENIVSIGWPKAAELLYEGAPDDKILEVAEENYGQTPGYILKILKCFSGQQGGNRTPINAGDIVIIDGQKDIRGKSVIRGIAEVGDINKWNSFIDDDFPHILYREAEWLYNDGPVAKSELSSKFQIGGSASTHLPGTLQQWNPEDNPDETVHELVEELEEAPPILPKSYDFEFDERVVQEHIADHAKQFQENLQISPGEIKREYQTESGDFADFVVLPTDEEITVVETKVEAAGPQAAKQLNEYIKDLQSEYDNDVRGILVAEEFYNYEGIEDEIGDSDITLRRYHVTLDYEEVQLKSPEQ